MENSIQELENVFWPDQKEYPTGLVERCHHYRKIKLKDLQIHQIITLLIQDIGSEYLMPIVLKKMDNNITEEDDYDGSSFITSLEHFNTKIFQRNPEFHTSTLDTLRRKKDEIENIVGWKKYVKIVRKIEEKAN